jgi:HEAT repeat protein
MPQQLRIRIVVVLFVCIIFNLLISCASIKDQWIQTQSANSISAYELFIKEHPDSGYSKTASDRLNKLYEERDWNIACNANSIKGYETYLKVHKKAPHTEEAAVRLQTRIAERDENIDWEKIATSRSVEEYSSFLRKYPHGLHFNEAHAKIDDILFANLTTNPTIGAVEAYLSLSDDPKHANEALIIAGAIVVKDPRLANVKKSISAYRKTDPSNLIHVVWQSETPNNTYLAYRDPNGQVKLFDREGSLITGRSVAEAILARFSDIRSTVFMINPCDLSNINNFYSEVAGIAITSISKNFNSSPYNSKLRMYGANDNKTSKRNQTSATILSEWIDPFEWIKDEDKCSRLASVICIKEIKEPRAFYTLLTMLKDSEADVRYAVIEALGEKGDERAAVPLIDAMKDADYTEREAIKKALKKIYPNLGCLPTNPLLVLLKDPNPDTKIWAIQELSHQNDPILVTPLIHALKDENPKVRRYAAQGLYNVNDRRAVKPLIDVLDDTDSEVRIEVIRALGMIRDAQAAEPLIDTLKDKDADVRKHVIMALGRIGNPKAVEPLIAILNDKYAEPRSNRMKAADALGKINDPRAYHLLMAALKDNNIEIIAGAHDYYIRKGKPGTESVLNKALFEFGDVLMAEDFLNSGNNRLSSAAEKWATSHGYRSIVNTSDPHSSPRWGE